MKSLSRVQLFVTPRTDYSLLGSSVHGIFQARILEWAAISFSKRPSRPRDWTQVSRVAARHFTFWATKQVLLVPLNPVHDFGSLLNSPQLSNLLCHLFPVGNLTNIALWFIKYYQISNGNKMKNSMSEFFFFNDSWVCWWSGYLRLSFFLTEGKIGFYFFPE